jgi:hypothetical protein
LRIEKLVGKHHASAGKSEGFADANGFCAGKRMLGDPCQHAARGLRAYLDEGMLGGIQSGGAKERGASGRHEFTEEGPETGGGIKVRRPIAAHSQTVAPVIAHLGVIESEMHEGIES